MAETALTVQSNSLEGLEPTYAAANADGNYFTNDGKTLLHVKNDDSSSHTVTVDSPTLCNQGETHDPAIAIPAGEERIIGPFPAGRFNTSGNVHLTYDDVTSVTVAAISNA
jgi:hypothetical protein